MKQNLNQMLKKEKGSIPKKSLGMAHISSSSRWVESHIQWYLNWLPLSVEFSHALEHFSDANFSYSLVSLGHSDTLVTVSVQIWLMVGFWIKNK